MCTKITCLQCKYSCHTTHVPSTRALTVHARSLDVDYSPTGKEFVTGSYDKTLRIFPVDEGRSREIYHTQRMQKIFCVKYSGDAHYVFSGSDDTNIRIWKSDASRQLGIVRTLIVWECCINVLFAANTA